MKQYRAGLVTLMLMASALAAPIAGIAASDGVVADFPVFEEPNSQVSLSMPKTNASSQLPLALASVPASSQDVRDVPSINGRYSVGGRTLLPYIGAGFSGGYSSEFNRSLNWPPPTQNDSGLRSQFGQSLSPNEFQLGVRVPF